MKTIKMDGTRREPNDAVSCHVLEIGLVAYEDGNHRPCIRLESPIPILPTYQFVFESLDVFEQWLADKAETVGRMRAAIKGGEK